MFPCTARAYDEANLPFVERARGQRPDSIRRRFHRRIGGLRADAANPEALRHRSYHVSLHAGLSLTRRAIDGKPTSANGDCHRYDAFIPIIAAAARSARDCCRPHARHGGCFLDVRNFCAAQADRPRGNNRYFRASQLFGHRPVRRIQCPSICSGDPMEEFRGPMRLIWCNELSAEMSWRS